MSCAHAAPLISERTETIMATVKVLNEAIHTGYAESGWHFALQYTEVTHSGQGSKKAYRFVCRPDHGNADAHEAHFPTLADAELLIREAKRGGWDLEPPVTRADESTL